MKLTSSIAAIVALSGMAFAGGDIVPPVFEQEIVEVPVEPVYIPAPAPVVIPAPVVVEAPKPIAVAPVVAANNWYIGLGATKMKAKQSADATTTPVITSMSDSQTGITGRIGYDFMNYLGAELRAASATSGADTGNEKIKQVGLYLKPNVDLTDSLNLYGLLGASKVNMSNPSDLNDKETGLSYGLGLDYDVSNSFSLFVDVVDYLRKSDNNDVYGATLGAAYHF